jgi:hypothetical protein
MKLLETIHCHPPASTSRGARARRRFAWRASLQNTLPASGVPNCSQQFIPFVLVTLDKGQPGRLRTLGLWRTC